MDNVRSHNALKPIRHRKTANIAQSTITTKKVNKSTTQTAQTMGLLNKLHINKSLLLKKLA